ncbi:MAG: signal peptidase I [Faecalibacillus sp.]
MRSRMKIFNETDRLLDQYIKKAKKERLRIRRFVHFMIIFVVIFVVFQTFGFAKINSDSMSPTLENGQFIVYNKLSNEYKKDDLVVIEYDHQTIVRRIVGMSGDHIEIDNIEGQLYINDEKEKTKHSDLTVTDPEGIKFPLYVADNQVFVLCDKRSNTNDSRKIGCIHVKDIIGKVIFYY